MLLIPRLNFNDNLTLDAYSFSSIEIDAVGFILERARIRTVNERLTKDRKGRFGLRFYVTAPDVPKLENTLNLKFVGREDDTKVKLGDTYFNADGGGPSSYRCSRIDTPPHNCETIYADDEKEAIVKCALIANSKNWLGGVPSLGSC